MSEESTLAKWFVGDLTTQHSGLSIMVTMKQ